MGAVDAGRPCLNEGRYAEAADRTRELASAHPQAPMLVYMLAVCECKAGRTEAALEALRAAAVSRRMRMIAAKDPELDAIRGEPAFAEIIGD